MTRLAVAIASMWAGFAWAQPVQPVDTQVSEQYDTNSDAVATAQVDAGDAGLEAGPEADPFRGVSLLLSAGIGYDDNVFRTESNTMDDFFWSVQPSIHFVSGFGRHRYRLGYDGLLVKYFEFSDQDFDDHRLFADISLDLTRKLDLDLDGEVRRGHDPRGAIGTCIVCASTPDTWWAYSVGGELVVGRAISRAQLIPSIRFSGIRYTNNNQSNRDFDRQDYGLRGLWRFSPRLYAIGEGHYAVVDHLDPSNTLDRTETDLLGGIGWEATAKTSGEILIGTLIQDFDNPAQGSSTNFNWLVRVFWEPKPYSKVTLFTNRTAREDAAGGIGHFLADTFGVAWNHGFTERLLLTANADYTLARYDTGRKDNYLSLRLELTRDLNRWLDVGVEYRYLNRRSNIPGIDYDDNIILLKLTAGLDHHL